MSPLLRILLSLSITRVHLTNGLTINDVNSVLETLAKLDKNAAGSDDITLNYQNMASGKDFTHDNAPKP
ncbi:hypothetical protein Tcan_03434 [Toxocara canis]|uniref:EndoU domain-containing protein n=1 Tax=Toxocara canis TaxID=6265 RepID=A0A0B2VVT8_TOXCA|nr:hypothetical protein Tcan_03434 [Toxocara canis]